MNRTIAASRGPASDCRERTRYDLRVLQALRRITRAVDIHSRRLLNQHQITGPQLVCLLSISEMPGITPSVLAREVHLSPSTVIGILDRLEAKELVSRRRATKDRRLVRVSLTGDGLALVANAPSPLQDTLADAMNELPEKELAVLATSLDRIVELMEVRHVDAAALLEDGPIEHEPDAMQSSRPLAEPQSAGGEVSRTHGHRDDREKP